MLFNLSSELAQSWKCCYCSTKWYTIWRNTKFRQNMAYFWLYDLNNFSSFEHKHFVHGRKANFLRYLVVFPSDYMILIGCLKIVLECPYNGRIKKGLKKWKKSIIFLKMGKFRILGTPSEKHLKLPKNHIQLRGSSFMTAATLGGGDSQPYSDICWQGGRGVSQNLTFCWRTLTGGLSSSNKFILWMR